MIAFTGAGTCPRPGQPNIVPQGSLRRRLADVAALAAVDVVAQYVDGRLLGRAEDAAASMVPVLFLTVPSRIVFAVLFLAMAGYAAVAVLMTLDRFHRPLARMR